MKESKKDLSHQMIDITYTLALYLGVSKKYDVQRKGNRDWRKTKVIWTESLSSKLKQIKYNPYITTYSLHVFHFSKAFLRYDLSIGPHSQFKYLKKTVQLSPSMTSSSESSAWTSTQLSMIKRQQTRQVDTKILENTSVNIQQEA